MCTVVVPSPARGVNASTQSPVKVRVQWLPPLYPHSAPTDVLYSVEWRTNNEGVVEKGHLEVTPDILKAIQNSNSLYTDIEGLKPQTVYNFTVSSTMLYNESLFEQIGLQKLTANRLKKGIAKNIMKDKCFTWTNKN